MQLRTALSSILTKNPLPGASRAGWTGGASGLPGISLNISVWMLAISLDMHSFSRSISFPTSMPRSPAMRSEYDMPLERTLTLEDRLLDEVVEDADDDDDFVVVVDCFTTLDDVEDVAEKLELELALLEYEYVELVVPHVITVDPL